MLIDKMRTLEDLTVSERTIVDYILKNINHLSTLTSEMLAKETYTSKATVSRLCKKLGVKDYHEFKQNVLLESEEWLRIQNMSTDEPLNQSSTYDDIVKTIPAIYDAAIRKTRMDLDKNSIIRISSRLKRAEKIDIYGTGIMYHNAQIATFKFLNLGKECSAYDALNEHYVIADKNRQKKLIIVLSLTGGNANMVKVAKTLKDRGFYVVGIGGSEMSDLKENCHEYIGVRAERELMNLDIITYTTAINYILDILFLTAMTSEYDYNVLNAINLKNYKEMKQSHQN